MYNESGGIEKKVHFLPLSFTSVGENKENESYLSFSHLNLPSYVKRLLSFFSLTSPPHISLTSGPLVTWVKRLLPSPFYLGWYWLTLYYRAKRFQVKKSPGLTFTISWGLEKSIMK